MKRSAMVIIMAISCAGNLITFSGETRLSSPSVSVTGGVVSVMTLLPSTRKIRRREKCTALLSPSAVTRMNHRRRISVCPLPKNRLSTKVNTSRMRSGRSERSIMRAGSPDTLQARATYSAMGI